MHQRTKNIEINIHFIKEQILRKQLVTEYYPIEYQLANLLTKPLLRQMFM